MCVCAQRSIKVTIWHRPFNLPLEQRCWLSAWQHAVHRTKRLLSSHHRLHLFIEIFHFFITIHSFATCNWRSPMGPERQLHIRHMLMGEIRYPHNFHWTEWWSRRFIDWTMQYRMNQQYAVLACLLYTRERHNTRGNDYIDLYVKQIRCVPWISIYPLCDNEDSIE